MSGKSRSSGGHDAGGNLRWLLTYSDMITLLLAFFVIMYAISKVDAKRYEAIALSLQGAFKNTAARAPIPSKRDGAGGALPKLDRATVLMQQFQAQLAYELERGLVQVEKSPAGVVLRFQDALLFERGKADLRADARPPLAKIAGVVVSLPNAVEVEGHTDSLPIKSAQFPSNWELSVARATAVVREMVEAGGISPLRLAARGLGEYKPLYPNDQTTGEPRNRRVELRILVTPDPYLRECTREAERADGPIKELSPPPERKGELIHGR